MIADRKNYSNNNGRGVALREENWRMPCTSCESAKTPCRRLAAVAVLLSFVKYIDVVQVIVIVDNDQIILLAAMNVITTGQMATIQLEIDGSETTTQNNVEEQKKKMK